MVIDYTGGREQLLQYNENVLYVYLGGNYRCKIPPMKIYVVCVLSALFVIK